MRCKPFAGIALSAAVWVLTCGFPRAGELDPAALIKAQLCLAFIDLDLFLTGDERSRPVEEIETGVQRKLRTAQAAVAFRLHLDLEAALDPDFALGIG